MEELRVGDRAKTLTESRPGRWSSDFCAEASEHQFDEALKPTFSDACDDPGNRAALALQTRLGAVVLLPLTHSDLLSVVYSAALTNDRPVNVSQTAVILDARQNDLRILSCVKWRRG